ncbi:MAG: radical SAM protein [Candidatus Omnitrophota bacterium]|nr:radical SAM protein [Candidatus Omnitrophota bacterium]
MFSLKKLFKNNFFTDIRGKDTNFIKLPTYCCICVTENCFFHCQMCQKWKFDINFRDPKEPNLEHRKMFIDCLRRLVKGKFQINFAGGEPLIREETLSLIKYASQKGFVTSLATNGFLINEQMAKEMAGSDVAIVNISLDSLKPERHDYLRGVKGAYSKVMEAIELLDKYAKNASISICTVISNHNIDEVADIVKWAQANDKIDGIGFQAISQPFGTPEDPFWYLNPEYSHLWPNDIARANKAMDELIKLKKSNYNKLGNPLTQLYVYKAYFSDPNKFIKQQKCHIDTQAITIGHIGEIKICCYMEPIGNIKCDDINDAWFSERAKKLRVKIKNCKKNCQSMVNCNFDESEDYVY